VWVPSPEGTLAAADGPVSLRFMTTPLSARLRLGLPDRGSPERAVTRNLNGFSCVELTPPTPPPQENVAAVI
jgi:hypothetical protein